MFSSYRRRWRNSALKMHSSRYTRDIHGPELLIPRRVFEDGSFSTYSLPNFYNRREISERGKRSPGSADKLHLVLPFNGIDHHVELSPYHEFISPDMVVETRGAGISTNLNEGLRFRRAADRQCHYRGIVRGHDNSRAALSLCDGVVGIHRVGIYRNSVSEGLGINEPWEAFLACLYFVALTWWNIYIDTLRRRIHGMRVNWLLWISVIHLICIIAWYIIV